MPRTKKRKLPWLTLLFILIPVLIAIFAVFKLVNTNETTVYAKIKIAQGYWWAATKDPNIWIADNVKKGDQEIGFFNQPVAEIEDVRYYPSYPETPGETRYAVTLTAKLKAGYNNSNKRYSFKRADLTVGSPIEIDTSKTLITGVVTELSDHPFEDNYVEKEVTLTKDDAYIWKYDRIKVGTKYFDGTDNVLEIVGKRILGSTTSYSNTVYNSSLYQKFSQSAVDKKYKIAVDAKIKVLQKGDKLVYGNEKVVQEGAEFPISEADSQVQDFYITAIK